MYNKAAYRNSEGTVTKKIVNTVIPLHRLRGCHLPWPPYTYIEESEDKTRNISFGILPQAIRLLQSVTGFVLEEYQPADGKWGAPVDPHNITGEWNGIVQELRSGRADFGHNPFGTTVERSKVITYGHSIDKDRYNYSLCKNLDLNMAPPQTFIATPPAIFVACVTTITDASCYCCC